MRKVDMIVKAPHVYTMAGEGVGYRADTAFAVEGGKIVALADIQSIEGEYTSEKIIVASHHAIFPGLIDAHMHTGWCICRGLAQDTNYWMMYGMGPFSAVLTEDDQNHGSNLAIIEGIRAGTTTFGDGGDNIRYVCQAVDRFGIRGHLVPMIRSAKHKVYQPGELYEFDDAMGEKSLQENIDLYDQWHGKGEGRIKILFGPQGADFVSLELLKKCQHAAKERNTKLHVHTAQGDRETFQIEKRYGKRPIPWLKENGFLDETWIAIHLTDASDEETRLLAKSGASMVLCPGSIGIIDGIVPPSVAFQKAGGNCALGSDQAPGNNCHNIINEMKNVALFNKIKFENPEVIPAWKALRMATIEGARALGLGEEIGSLEEGKCADFIAIDLEKPTMMPLYTTPMRNMVPNLVYSARGDEVALSVVNGKVIYCEGQILNVNESEMLSQASKRTKRIGEEASDKFWEIDGTNAQFMKMDCL